MEESRRGFLKTLGKLGVALGITTAACSAHYHHGPHPKHPAKAKIGTTPKANMEELTELSHTIQKAGFNRANGGDKVGELMQNWAARKNTTTYTTASITPSKNLDWGQGKATAEAQKTIDAITNLRLDNVTQQMNPHMIVPQHVYDFMRAKEAIRELDPYNWGKVFELEWQDWAAGDPTHATVTGRWLAKVRPQFYGVFDGKQVYYQSQSIAMAYLVSAAQNPDEVKKYAKEQCHRQLVDTLQDVILERIKRDVKQNA